jgi:hypothetical protein
MLDCLYFHFTDSASAAAIQSFLIDFLGISFEPSPSTTYITNVINNPKKEEFAKQINQQLDKLVAPTVSTLCGDELCSPQPNIFYTSTIPHTGYCLNLNVFDDHLRGRGSIWQECYKPLINNGLNPNLTLCDQAPGTLSGHRKTFPEAYHIIDFFHQQCNFSDLVDKAQRDIDELNKTKQQIIKKRTEINCLNDQVCIFNAPDLLIHQIEVEENIKDMLVIHENLKTLYSWLVGYIITLAGYNIPDRVEIYDFIVEEIQKCAILEVKNKANSLVETLTRQKDKLLYFLKYLDDQFEGIANESKQTVTKEQLWQINKYLHYSPENPKAISLAKTIIDQISIDSFDNMTQIIHSLHQKTETCSSYVENHIGRIKPIIHKHKNFTQGHMERVKLFISCSNLHSSRDYRKRSLTPLQLTLGTQHGKHWIDFFYDKPVIRQHGIRLEKVNHYNKCLNAA